MEIRLKYINQDSFYGSDYFIKRVDYEEKWDRVKRLGDTYYENELLERSVTEKYGSNLKIGKVDNTAAAIGATGNRENFVPDEFEIQKRFKDSLDKINCLEANNTKDKIQVFIKNFDRLRFMDRYNLWVYIVENILIKKFIEGQEIDIYAVFKDNIW